jgi:tetratricopeptide (TPR) repeat protein
VLLLLLLALAPSAPPEPRYDLAAYLEIAEAYASSQREAAVREIQAWPLPAVRMAVADLQGRGKQIRARSSGPGAIAFRTIEAAVLLHAEAGLLALRASAMDAAECHLRASTDLFHWSSEAAREARARELAEGAETRPLSAEGVAVDGLQSAVRPEDDQRPRIGVVSMSVAMAAGALAAGNAATALQWAQDARRWLPLDPTVLVVWGAVAEGLAEQERIEGREKEATDWRDEAARALAGAVAQPEDQLQVTGDLPTLRREARLRLGRIALENGWLKEARKGFEEVDKTGDERQRYLARLLLGRVAEREGRADEAVASYRRALEAWPESQAATLALAHALEAKSGTAVARTLVATAVLAPRRDDAPVDPWRSYLFGPPGLAAELFERVRERALGP